MAEININTLFSDVLGNSADQDKAKRDEAFNQASLVGTLGGMAAYLAPQRSADLSSSVGGLLGVDTRTESQKLKEQLQSLGTPQTDEEHKAYADLLDKIQAGSGVQYMIALGQERRKQEALGIEQQKADTSQQVAEVRQGELDLVGQSEENLAAWRIVQGDNEARDLAIKEEKNRIDNILADNKINELGAADRKAVREASASSREQADLAKAAINTANEYLALEPLAGAPAKAKERFKALLGREDEVTLLRTQFTRLKNNMVMESLPPGVASDKDIEIAMSGFPTATANGEYIASYMRGMAKIAAITASREEARALHLMRNKGMDAEFMEEWRETQKDPNWEQKLEERYNLVFDPKTDAEGNIIPPLSQAQLKKQQEEIQELEDARIEEQKRVNALNTKKQFDAVVDFVNSQNGVI